MTDLSNILIYLSLGLVVLWTARMARSKGRNPFIWGGLSLALMLIPSWSELLGMAPMIVLLFLKAPQAARQEVRPDTVTCPKCRALHAAGHTYCVNCGWELAKPYVEETPGRYEEAPVSHVNVNEPELVTRPAEPSQPTAEPELVSEQNPSTEDSPAEETGGEAVEAAERPEAPQLVFRRPLTPAGFTEYGLSLFHQGKFQEAIDQFTKAIALDPTYVGAWASRAEAYLRLGRKNKAEEDRRHLDGLRGEATG
jgi:tetratricopeptide (TPR) repeat protein